MVVLGTLTATKTGVQQVTLSCSIVSGSEDVTEKGFVYNTTGSPTISDTKIITTGDFETIVNSLSEGTYYFRAYITDLSSNTVYSNEEDITIIIVTFTEFSVINKPTTIQANKTGIKTHASLVTEVGYVYNTTGSPTISDNKVISSVVEISGKSYINNVNLGELFGAHYVRAYAKIGTDVFYTTADKYIYRFSNEDFNNVNINTIKDSLIYGNNLFYGVNDMLGNYTVGNDTAGTFVSEEGKFNGSYYVDSSSTGLITTDLENQIRDKSLTFESWMKIVYITGDYYLIGDTGFAFRIYVQTNKEIMIQNTLMRFDTRDAIAQDNVFTEINDWIHIVYTLNNTTGISTFYINGVKQVEGAIRPSIDILTTIKLLFSNAGKAYVDTFYFYNRALSDIEVFRLYNYNNGVEFYGGVIDGCKAYFKLDNGLNDSTQNNNTITLQSNANFSDGKINQGILLNTTNDSGNDMGVKFNNSSTFISGTRQQSFGGWFKFNNISNDKYWVLFSSYTSTYYRNTFILGYDDGWKMLCLSNSGTMAFPSTNPDFNNWNHYVFVYDGINSIIKIYLNGLLESTTSFSTGAEEGDLYMQNLYNMFVPVTEGFETDEVFFFERLLTTDDITTIYNDGDGVQYDFTISTPVITNPIATNIRYFSFTVTSELTSTGNVNMLQKGFIYNTIGNPTINDNKIVCDNSFSSLINQLEYGTTYYFKSFAENIEGIVYSDEIEITTLETENMIVIKTNDNGPAIKISFN